MTRWLNGQCQCGNVRYRVADAFAYSANCHCTDCRRMTGSAFKPFAGITVDQFELTAGADRLMIFGSEINHDGRCNSCGSLLYSQVRDGLYVHVTLGTLTDAPAIRPTEHIFVGSKAPWYDILDDLPQYARHASDGPPLRG